nr:hypothetical protein [Tanacetum cinerariifolium]
MFESPIPVMDSGGRNHNHLLQAEVELSDDSQGKLYDSYIKKRDARLRESWDSNGAEKEMMKEMNDSLERHSTEMKATFFSWSKDRHNSPLDFWHLHNDEDLSGLGISRNIEGKKPSVTSLESSEGVILTPTNEGHMKSLKNVEPRWFLRKNTGIGPGVGSVAAKMKASMVSEAVSKDEEYDKPVESRMSPESEILFNSESENGNTSQSFSQVDHTLVVELPATVTSPFPVQDSPGESPMSWNSHTNYPFSYNHEALILNLP